MKRGSVVGAVPTAHHALHGRHMSVQKAHAPLMPLPSEAKLAAAYTLEWLRQRRKESQIARERRRRARSADQLQEFAQEFEPARIAPSPRWEERGEAVQQAAAAQVAQAAQVATQLQKKKRKKKKKKKKKLTWAAAAVCSVMTVVLIIRRRTKRKELSYLGYVMKFYAL